MKKQIVLMIIALFPVFLLAQSTPMTAFYQRYADKPGYESSEILPGSMSFEWEKDMNNTIIRDMLSNIESIRILKYKKGTENAGEDKFWKKMLKTARDGQYNEVANANADNIIVHLYMLKEPAGKAKEVALLLKDVRGVTLVTVSGNLDFSALFSKENMHSLHEMAEYFKHNKGMCPAAKN
jgi:hypothetical protein